MYACIHIYIYTCVHACIHSGIHAYICMYMHIYTHHTQRILFIFLWVPIHTGRKIIMDFKVLNLCLVVWYVYSHSYYSSWSSLSAIVNPSSSYLSCPRNWLVLPDSAMLFQWVFLEIKVSGTTVHLIKLYVGNRSKRRKSNETSVSLKRPKGPCCLPLHPGSVSCDGWEPGQLQECGSDELLEHNF